MSFSARYLPLRKLGEIVSGSTPSTNVKEYWDGDIPWITPADLTGYSGIFFNGKLRKISKAGYNSCSTKLLPTGSILFSSRAPIGHCVVTTYPLCTNQGFKSIIPNQKLDSVYGYFALIYFTPKIIARGRGATFAEVNKEIFGEIEIPVPSISEQKRIAAILEKADRLRRLRRYALELGEGFLQSVFLEMFGDPIRNPKNFTVAEFGSVCDSHLGKMLDAKQQIGKHKKPYLRNVNIQWNRIDLTDLAEMDFDEADQRKYRLRFGDVLICEGGEVGRAAIWKNEISECYFQKALHRARPKPELAVSEYIVWLLKNLADNGGLSDFTSQVTIAHLTGVKLKTIKFPLPPLALQQEFSKIVKKHESLIKQQTEALRQAEHLFQSLLHRAYHGEL